MSGRFLIGRWLLCSAVVALLAGTTASSQTRRKERAAMTVPAGKAQPGSSVAVASDQPASETLPVSLL